MLFRKNYLLSLIIPLSSLLIIGCDFQSSSGENQQNTSMAGNVENQSLGQSLPIGAKLLVGEEIIELEVAETPQQQQIGLMYRQKIPANRGMLFPFNPPQPVSFWMKNVSIPLDMIFVSQGVVKKIVTAPPCEKDPCPLYNSNVNIDQVIELAEGRAGELQIEVGDRLNLEMLSSEKNISK